MSERQWTCNMTKDTAINKVFIDWSLMKTPDDVYTEILGQIKAPKSHKHSIEALQSSIVVGTIKRTKPPYLFINANVCLAPVAVQEIMLWIFRVFNQSAVANPGSEVIVTSGHREELVSSVRDPESMDRNEFISLIACAQWPINDNMPPRGPARDHEQKKLSALHDKAVIDFLKTSVSPEELHVFARSYNWDQGFIYPTKLVERSACDLNTALLVFWSIGVDFYQREYIKRPNTNDRYHRDAWDLIQRIIKNVKNGKYTQTTMPEDFKREIVYVPVEEQLWEIDALMYGNNKANRKKKTASKKKRQKK